MRLSLLIGLSALVASSAAHAFEQRAFGMPQRPTISNVGVRATSTGTSDVAIRQNSQYNAAAVVVISPRDRSMSSSGAQAPMRPRSASSGVRTSISDNMEAVPATAPPSPFARRHPADPVLKPSHQPLESIMKAALVLVGIMLANAAAAEETMKTTIIQNENSKIVLRQDGDGTIERQIERRPGYTRVEQKSGNSRTTVVQSSDPADAPSIAQRRPDLRQRLAPEIRDRLPPDVYQRLFNTPK